MNRYKPFHILLAEDDEDDAFLFQEALGQIPMEIQLNVAQNGMQLMHMLNSSLLVPDVIFLDMNMPIKNGLECLNEIRKSDRFEEVPVIILSTSIARYLLESAHSGGANLYIQKPNNFSGLVEILKSCLEQKDELQKFVKLEQFLITGNNNY